MIVAVIAVAGLNAAKLSSLSQSGRSARDAILHMQARKWTKRKVNHVACGGGPSAKALRRAFLGAGALRWAPRGGGLLGPMILAFIIVNNYGRARHLKFYKETVRARRCPGPALSSRTPPTP